MTEILYLLPTSKQYIVLNGQTKKYRVRQNERGKYIQKNQAHWYLDKHPKMFTFA